MFARPASRLQTGSVWHRPPPPACRDLYILSTPEDRLGQFLAATVQTWLYLAVDWTSCTGIIIIIINDNIISDSLRYYVPLDTKLVHFKDILPSRSLGFVLKNKNQTQQSKRTITQNKHKETKASWPLTTSSAVNGNGTSLFLKK